VVNSSEILEKAKSLLNLRFDRELADLLGISAAALSERRRKNSIPVEAIKKILLEKSIDTSFLDSMAGSKEMKQDSSITMNQESVRLKDEVISIQKKYIERLEKTIERLEEDKKKRNQTKVPQWYNQPDNWQPSLI
jgi:transcriptional regulator with XRE-family HTH domain